MSAESDQRRAETTGRLQFSLRTLLGLMTVCSVVFALSVWVGTGSTMGILIASGFLVVVLGDWLRRDKVMLAGGAAMVAGCLGLFLLGLLALLIKA